MIKCPNCGNENRELARFCSRCSTPLSDFVDYYMLLNLAPDAPADEMGKALHDAARSDRTLLTSEQLGEAIDTLTDPRKRDVYDKRRIVHLANQQLKKADFDSENYYRRLGVSRFARQREIRAAFESLAYLVKTGKISHDDLRQVEEARTYLTDPARRRTYNRALSAASSPDAVPVPHEFNYYDYLGLDQSASEYQIRKADEALRGPLTRKAKMGDQTAEETLRQLNLVIQTLTNDAKRAEYDAEPTHDVFRFQTPGRLSPRLRSARFAVIESIIYGPDSDGLSPFGGPWPADAYHKT